MPLSRQEIIGALREFIITQVIGRDLELTEDTALIEDGHLTSIQTVELIGFIVERWGVEVEPEEVDEKNFRSLSTIADLVAGKKA